MPLRLLRANRGVKMLTEVELGARAGRPGAEYRQDARKRLMLRVAKLRCHDGEYLCVIHDVSESGVRLRLFHAHPPEGHMFLELANGALYAVERRWIDGDYAGYRFSSRIDTAAFVSESCPTDGRAIRLRISHPVWITADGESGPAMLADLSQEGACIESARTVARRAPLNLEFPESAPRRTHVCWRKGASHGVIFQESLTLEGLARLALQLQPYGEEAAPTRNESGPRRALSA